MQDGQDEEEKGLEDLNVYRTSEQSGEKVREDLNRYRHPGTDCFWRRAAAARRGTIILFIMRILFILLQTKKSALDTLRSSRTLASRSC